MVVYNPMVVSRLRGSEFLVLGECLHSRRAWDEMASKVGFQVLDWIQILVLPTQCVALEVSPCLLMGKNTRTQPQKIIGLMRLSVHRTTSF